jgi:hypothetical protein
VSPGVTSAMASETESMTATVSRVGLAAYTYCLPGWGTRKSSDCSCSGGVVAPPDPFQTMAAFPPSPPYPEALMPASRLGPGYSPPEFEESLDPAQPQTQRAPASNPPKSPCDLVIASKLLQQLPCRA